MPATSHHSELQAIIARPPAQLTRWGNSILLLIVVGLLASTVFIRYAERISVPLRLAAPTAPVSVRLGASLLGQLCVQHRQVVTQGQIVGYTTADGVSVTQLQALARALQARPARLLPACSQLGPLQADYAALIQAVTAGGPAYEPQRLALRQRVLQWLDEHALRAPVAGQISLSSWAGKRSGASEADKPLLSILPVIQSGMEVGNVLIAQNQLRYIKEHQPVQVSFEAYPAREYGTVPGRIEQIADLPEENGYYQALVSFPHGLQTTTKQNLSFRTGMDATAEMVVAYKPLIQKLFPALSGLF